LCSVTLSLRVVLLFSSTGSPVDSRLSPAEALAKAGNAFMSIILYFNEFSHYKIITPPTPSYIKRGRLRVYASWVIQARDTEAFSLPLVGRDSCLPAGRKGGGKKVKKIDLCNHPHLTSPIQGEEQLRSYISSSGTIPKRSKPVPSVSLALPIKPNLKFLISTFFSAITGLS